MTAVMSNLTDPMAVPLVMADLDTGAILQFLSTITVFGTANDVTLAKLTWSASTRSVRPPVPACWTGRY